MSDYQFYFEEYCYDISNTELIEHLKQNGYVFIKGEVDDLDYTDRTMLDEIIEKFLYSDSFSRDKIWKQIIKEESKNLSEYNNMDLFYHLENESFDFLDNIDTQEIIEHLEGVGYEVIIENK